MGQVDVFNVELVVVVHVGHLTPIGIAGRPHRRLFVGRAADEPGAAQNDDPQAFSLAAAGLAEPFASGARAAFGFFSTIRSTKPQSLACSGVIKKSRSIARSTSSSGRLQCFA